MSAGNRKRKVNLKRSLIGAFSPSNRSFEKINTAESRIIENPAEIAKVEGFCGIVAVRISAPKKNSRPPNINTIKAETFKTEPRLGLEFEFELGITCTESFVVCADLPDRNSTIASRLS